MKNTGWFRVYSEVVSDRKLTRVCTWTGQPKAVVIGVWITLLALANESPVRGHLLIGEDLPMARDEIAGEIGLDIETTNIILNAFAQVKMLHLDGECLVITHWEDRQFASDTSAERTKQYREKRKNQGMPVAPRYNFAEIIERDNEQCIYCGSDQNLCVDHIFPVQLGGTDHTNNLGCACKQCNSGKAGRTPEQAGYTIINPKAQERYNNYLTERVTVTVTPCDGHSDALDTDTDTDSYTDQTQTQTEVSRGDLATVSRCYEQEIGLLSPIVADEIKEALAMYPAVWITDAIKAAARQNKRRMSYISGILKNWAAEGRNGKDSSPSPPRWQAKIRGYRQDDRERGALVNKNNLPELWGTLSRKVLASVLVDDGAVFPAVEKIGNRVNWISPKERPIWRAVLSCLEGNTPPTVETVAARTSGTVEVGYVQSIANLFNDDDNRHLRYNIAQLIEIGILANVRQVGRDLADVDKPEDVTGAVDHATNELGGLLASKSSREPFAGCVIDEAWRQIENATGEGVPTGFGWFDQLTGGLWPGMNYWVVAPYKAGKSTIMRNAVINTASQGMPVGVFCAEGSREMFALDCTAMIATRLLADQGLRGDALRLSGLLIRRHYWQKGFFNKQELEAINTAKGIWGKLPINLWDSKDGIRELTTLRYLVKRSKMSQSARVFWADYSQLFGSGMTIFERQSRTSLEVQDIAQTESVAFCMLAQQNEEQVRNNQNNESHSPGVKGGGDAAAAADFLLIPRIDPEIPSMMELRLKLSRHSRTGKAQHYLNPSSGLLMDKWIDLTARTQ